MFSLLLFLLVPLVLTALAWREGLHALAANADSTSHIRLRTWPTMFFLLGTVVIVLGLFIEHFTRTDLTSPKSLTAMVWMFCAGGLSSLAALVSSTWAMPQLRPLAFFAALAWTGCFAVVLTMLSGLRGLR